MTDLGIVIVTFNSRQEIDGCLESLTAAPPALRHQIVVVDNASRDGTADHVRTRWPGATVIDAGANLGFAAACNVGIRATTGPLVLLLNPDTRVPAGALDRLAARLRAQPDTAAVGPRIVDDRGRAELSFGPMIGPVAELRQKALVAGNRAGLPLISALVERMTRRSGKVDWVSGACLMAGRSDLEEVGLLDERYFLYTEDVDLCAALRARGRAVRFAADVEIVHLRGRSAAADPAAAEAVYRRSQLAFYAKHHPGWTPLLRIYLKLRGRLPDTRK